jgi:hypothetical protein
VRDFLVSCPPTVEAGEEGGVHQLKSLIDFFCFYDIFFIETSWRLVVNRKKLRLGQIFHWDFRKKILNEFWSFAEQNHF